MLKGNTSLLEKQSLSYDFTAVFDGFANLLPHLYRSPLKLMNFVLKCTNQLTEMTLFIILIGQTVHVLSSSEKRFINLRHLLIKWILYVVILILVHHVKHHTLFDELFIFLCNVFAAALVYPSKFMKSLHLKYFSYSEKKRYDESLDDPYAFEMTLFTRLLISLSTFCLNLSRFMITFIPLNQRRKVEEAIKDVNMTIVEQKYFGKIYDSNWKRDSEFLKQSNAVDNPENLNKSQKPKVPGKVEKGKNENSIRLKAEEHIEINLATILSSEQGRRKFAFYRDIEIMYNAETTELTITSQEDGKPITQQLEQIVVVNDQMIQLIGEEGQESLFVKFKSKKDKELFINYIYLQS